MRSNAGAVGRKVGNGAFDVPKRALVDSLKIAARRRQQSSEPHHQHSPSTRSTNF
jgi:hypothetical protein